MLATGYIILLNVFRPMDNIHDCTKSSTKSIEKKLNVFYIYDMPKGISEKEDRIILSVRMYLSSFDFH